MSFEECSFGSILIDGVTYEHDVVIDHGRVCFFSSRRRHTIFDCDWSSDVCSSDLIPLVRGKLQARPEGGVLAGTILADAGITWELDFSKLGAEEKENLAGAMKKLNGETVDRKSVV